MNQIDTVVPLRYKSISPLGAWAAPPAPVPWTGTPGGCQHDRFESMCGPKCMERGARDHERWQRSWATVYNDAIGACRGLHPQKERTHETDNSGCRG